MNIFILANEQQEKELLSVNPHRDMGTFRREFPEGNDFENYEAFFILTGSVTLPNPDLFGNKPVFLNEMIRTLTELSFPASFHRMNAWPGFLQRPLWEVVSNDSANAANALKVFNRKCIFVKDEPGFISARVISMIINEAFFASGENISTEEEIDLAMKSGTSYPYGPFEWTRKIGIKNIYALLEKLSQKEERYLPAPALKKLFLENQGKEI